MDDNFYINLLIIVGTIFFKFYSSKTKSRTTKKEIIPNKDPVYRPMPTINTHRQATKLDNTLAMQKISPPKHHVAVDTTTQYPPLKKVNRILRRYNHWQKAIIMHELIRPYD